MNSIKTSLAIIGFWGTRQGGRPENQDSCGFLDTTHGHLAVVCDGMGGGPAGKLASSLAVESILKYVRDSQEEDKSELIKNAIEHANKVILDAASQKHDYIGMGTTVVAVLFNEESAVVAHVGDSRVYQFRHGKMIFRTSDHSMVAEMVRNKQLTEEQARLSSQSNIITRALGGKNEELAEVEVLTYEKGDRFMLCSDGIWSMLPEKELIRRAAQTPSLPGAVDGIVIEVDELGRLNGNTHDNLTLAIIETKNNSTKQGEMRKKDRILIQVLMVLCALLLLSTVFYAIKAPNNDADVKLDQYISENKQLETENDSLKKEVQRLNRDIANAKSEVAEAKTEVANLKTQDADKAQKDAEKIKKEAEDLQKKAKQQDVQISDETKKMIDDVVGLLKKAREERNKKEKRGFRNQASQKLDQLIQKDQKHKDIYKYVQDKLKDNIADSNSPNANGHYNLLIKKLEGIK